MIVVDASVATKWRLREADSVLALDFLERHQGGICGPDLLAVEVGRALVAAANARRIGKDDASASIAGWLESIDRGDIILHPLDTRRISTAADIAMNLGHPLADCLYLALAVDLGVDLMTADAKFHTRTHVVYPRVKLLSDYGL